MKDTAPASVGGLAPDGSALRRRELWSRDFRGRTLVYTAESAESPPHVFALDADGSNLRQITRGAGESDVSLSADGSTIVYSAGRGSEVWIQPLQGGEPRKITDRANGPGHLSTSANLKLVADGGLALVRTQTTSDVVLISDWRRER